MDNINNEILLKYKKYDYLNQDKDNPLVKIFVSYIKPSFLFKSKILTPIHLGRAVEKDNSKDGKITDDDINWLHENCIGDDDFEGNISHVNRRVGFLTGTYWAWKNYEKLGNPEYFGSFGYRKLLNSAFLDDIYKYDIIAPQKRKWNISIKEEFSINNGKELFDAMKHVIKIFQTKDLKLFEDYTNGNNGYYYEMYVMKKEIFFNFCEWIFPMIFYLLKNYKNGIEITNSYKERLETFTNNSANISKSTELRDIAFIAERLTGFYIHKMSKFSCLKEEECIITDNTELLNIKKQLISKMRANLLKK